MENQFPTLLACMAAGLVGDGSECYGFDDEISRDHDWGPGFQIWLDDEDFEAWGPRLSAWYSGLPRVFASFGPRRRSSWGDNRVGVFSVSGFYRGFIGLGRAPESPDEWLAIPENALAAATNGRVFLDRGGRFSTVREMLAGFYPEDVRKKKIASRLMTAGQSGQYNFSRCVRRRDDVSAAYARTKFFADAFSLVFLLKKRYAPFYKWMVRAAMTIPEPGPEMARLARLLCRSPDYSEQELLIETMSALAVNELRSQGLTGSSSSFLCDHGPEVQQTIADPVLRERNVWVG
ncbi:MAG: DUF4037 domain-containing protein [Thermodesulfobacteriota bacterium]